MITILEGLQLTPLKSFSDPRGCFMEIHRQTRGAPHFVQDNFSISKKGTLRGMHFQSAPGQAKLITVLKGQIYDVVVDMRRESPTFKKWQAFDLSASDPQQLYIPVGFAHGFYTLSEEAHLFYKVTTFYDGATEKTFRFDDATVGIDWPAPPLIISDRDLHAPLFDEVVC